MQNGQEFMQTPEIFSTRDIKLASTLMTLGFPLVGIDYQREGTKPQAVGYFKFKQTDALEDVKIGHMQDRYMFRRLLENVNALRAEVTNMKLNPNSQQNERS